MNLPGVVAEQVQDGLDLPTYKQLALFRGAATCFAVTPLCIPGQRKGESTVSMKASSENKSWIPIIVAVLGLIGVTLTAYFGYREVIEPYGLSIRATQTAEAKLTLVASPAMSPAPPATATHTPTATPTMVFAKLEYIGRVIDDETEDPIRGAEVMLEFQGAPPIVYTDSKGIYRFTISFSGDRIPGRVRVSAKDYQKYDRFIELRRDNTSIEDIRLSPLPPSPTVAAVVSPDTPTPTPADTPMPINIPISIPPYPAPALVDPYEGASFTMGQDVKLVWEWERDLAENEFFEVRIRLEGAQEFDQIARTKISYEFIPASELTRDGTYEWQVAIVSLSGEEKGVSQIRSFEVR